MKSATTLDSLWILMPFFLNRYYANPSRKINVTYIQKMWETIRSQGHWSVPHDIYQNKNQRSFTIQQQYNNSTATYHSLFGVTSYNWTQLLQDHIAQLEPPPTYLVFNTGFIVAKYMIYALRNTRHDEK